MILHLQPAQLKRVCEYNICGVNFAVNTVFVRFMALFMGWASGWCSVKINVYLRFTQPNAHTFGSTVSPHILASIEGFKRHGLTSNLIPADKPEKCDLAVCWGIKKKEAMESGTRSLILERGYVGDRFYWTAMGYDGLNGRAKFYTHDVPSDRWEKHFEPYMQDWNIKHNSNEVLLVGQVRNDASIQHINIHEWYKDTQQKLRAAGFKVIFRPHPNDRFPTKIGADEVDRGPLSEMLKRVRYVVTFNSNTAVEAVLAGVPAVSCDIGSMAWPVTSQNILDCKWYERRDWVRELAYKQWSLDEITNGTAWDHLKQGMA